MKQTNTSSSKNNKKRTQKKRYELDRKFMKLYNITSLVRGPKYDIAELFQDRDFADQDDADEFKIPTVNFPKLAGTGYLREITDVNVTGLVDGQVLKWNVATGKWIPGTATGGGGGYTVETPSGTLDGSNTTFTVTVVPVYIVVDNATLFPNFGYTIAGLTLTLDVPPQNFIRSFHV